MPCPSRASSTKTPMTPPNNRAEFRIRPSTRRRPRGSAFRLTGCALLLLPYLLASGCRARLSTTTNTADAKEVSRQLQAITASATLPDLRLANFSDYRQSVQTMYEAIHYAPAWLSRGQPTPQALAVISALESSQKKGLNPEDYDASLWPARVAALQSTTENAGAVAHFDAALTVSSMRYLSNLRIGRLSPKPLPFVIDLNQEHFDLPQFLVQKVLTASSVAEVLSEAEPQYLGYKRTEIALQTYLSLASQDHSEPLPEPPKTLTMGDAYSGVTQLDQRLRLLGDLPLSALARPNATVYDGPLIEAVEHFQARHGLKSDGKLTKDTVRQLNAPLSVRVAQLEDSLERWRWLPANYPLLPVAVNIPGFKLRVFSDDHTIAMRMNVVVGQALRHQTPVFAKEMKYIIFRPYWNLPLDITQAEIVPKLKRNPHYLARKGFEVTDGNGRIATNGAVSPGTLARIKSGGLLVRQKPGPSNALGLVKFMFPNEFDVYLHSTPSPELFNRSRRDFSHGCIRVEKPAELAAWLLQDQPEWTLDKINAAMESGPDNRQVNLSRPVPVVIVYLTAIVEEDGQVYFFDDIYGHDSTLNAALAKGQIYH